MATSAERVTITNVTENYVDMLLPDGPNVTRAGLRHHFDPQRTVPIAENGVALLVDVEWDRYRYRVLFDTGMTGPVLLHNARALDLDLGDVDHVVISHGHPDHYGGLAGFLQQREAPVPISIHDDAFLPRYLRLASGEVAPYYNGDLTKQRITDLGGRLVIHGGPLEIGPGLIATGEIPREVSFEAPPTDLAAPNALIQLRDHHVHADTVPDDQALVITIGSDGIIVLVGCSHAGVINSIRYAQKITGRDRVVGVFGGFHLGFPGIPEVKTAQTIEALRDIDVEVLCPMHCTGMRAMMDIQRAFPDRFVMNCTGSRVFFDERTASIGAPRPRSSAA
jgi:7,8-dihydropterin-6-yl-methyl-4-(beta-D-ribofuranosyl)aminobenzene 5'-phosphate synthase